MSLSITTFITNNVTTKTRIIPQKRVVCIPENQTQTLWGILEQVYLHGQNEVNPLPCPSLSVGDTIIYEGDAYLILRKSFFCLTTGEVIED
jgi:hypothetical protein